MSKKKDQVVAQRLEGLARRHVEGEALEGLAAEVGMDESALHDRLREFFDDVQVGKVADRVPQDEVIQRYEAGDSINGIVAYLRELGLPANWYWVDSVLDRHRIIRHANPDGVAKGAPQGFSVGSATTLRRETPRHYLPYHRRSATLHTLRTFGDPSALPAESVLSERRLKRRG